MYDFIRRKSTQNARSHKRKIAFEDTMKEWKSGLGHDFDEKLFGVIVSGRIDRQFAKNVNLACKEGEEKKFKKMSKNFQNFGKSKTLLFS